MIDTKGIIHTIAGGGEVSKGAPLTGEVKGTDAWLGLPTSIALTNNNTIYFVAYTTSQVLQLREDTTGQWKLSPFFGARNVGDCGSTRQVGETQADQTSETIKNSLSIICEGRPRSVIVKDSCPGEHGETRIAISQDFYKYMNIVEIIKPCD